MSGEISPAIWTKTISCVPAYTHSYLVFLPASTHIPYRTHPHPSSPIYTYLHPPKPDIALYIRIIYVNLNENINKKLLKKNYKYINFDLL